MLRNLQLKMFPLIKSLFSETNPIPVKYALNLMGYNFGIERKDTSTLVLKLTGKHPRELKRD